MSTDSVTREQINALRSEAQSAGDQEMADTCERAIHSCQDSLEVVVKAISDAAAMNDKED